MQTPRLALYHVPASRSSAIIWLLEEAGAEYEVIQTDFETGTRSAAYRALNPTGKVPTLLDHGPDGAWSAAVTESTAIAAYIVELYPDAGLAPPLGTPERAAWHTWMVLRGVAFEPAFLDTAFPRAGEVPRGAKGWVGFEESLERIEAQLTPGPFLFGERFTAADVLIGSMLLWLRGWGKLQPTERVAAYLDRLAERPAKLRANAKDGTRTPA